MKYICLVYNDLEKLESISESELDRIVGGCGGWVADLESHGHHVLSMGLQTTRSSTSIRMRDGKLSVTDGPFAETKEFLGGFTVIEAKDLNEAIQIASKLPSVQIGTVEVRPVMDPTIEPIDPLERKLYDSIHRAHSAESD